MANPRVPVNAAAIARERASLTALRLDAPTAVSPPVCLPEKWISLYGFQGVVMFNLYDRHSLLDAVVRLVALQPRLNMAFYSKTSADSGKIDAHYSDIRHMDYCYDKLYPLFEPQNAENKYAVFVYAQDEPPPPPDHWEPRAGEGAILRCMRRGSMTFSIAYLRLPDNAARLCYNQYAAWMILVARILTPGSGLRMLRLDDLGIVAHSLVSLVLTSYQDLATHGGASFSRWSWREIVGGGAVENPLEMREILDVVPLDRATMVIAVPGQNPMAGAGKRLKRAEPGHANTLVTLRNGANSGIYGSNQDRTAVANAINALVAASTAAEEKKLLKYVTIWGNGCCWQSDDLLPNDYPLKPEWIDFPTDASLSSGFVVVRPTYVRYQAHVIKPDQEGREDGDGEDGRWRPPETVTFSFVMDEPLDEFRKHMHDAGFGHLARRCLHITQLDPYRPRTGRWGSDMMADEDIRSNRMDFNLEPSASNDVWMDICSQIVGTDIWIEEVSEESILQDVDLAKEPWGYRETYKNLWSWSQHAEFARQQNTDVAMATSASAARLPLAAGFFQSAGLSDSAPPLSCGKIHGPPATSGNWKLPLSLFLRGTPDGLPFVVGRNVATPSEAAALNATAADLYELALQRIVPCPHAGCSFYYVAGQTDAIEAHTAKAHVPLEKCNFCDHAFLSGTTMGDRIAHLKRIHGDLKGDGDDDGGNDGGDGGGGGGSGDGVDGGRPITRASKSSARKAVKSTAKRASKITAQKTKKSTTKTTKAAGKTAAAGARAGPIARATRARTKAVKAVNGSGSVPISGGAVKGRADGDDGGDGDGVDGIAGDDMDGICDGLSTSQPGPPVLLPDFLGEAAPLSAATSRRPVPTKGRAVKKQHPDDRAYRPGQDSDGSDDDILIDGVMDEADDLDGVPARKRKRVTFDESYKPSGDSDGDDDRDVDSSGGPAKVVRRKADDGGGANKTGGDGGVTGVSPRRSGRARKSVDKDSY